MGDSRVSRLEKAWRTFKHRSPGGAPGWEARFIEKKGCSLDDLPYMLGLRKCMDPTLRADFIVVCSFLVDTMKIEFCESKQEGKYLKLREEVDEGKTYPAVTGIREKARAVWLELKKSFKEAKIIWTIPHPVDCERWRYTKGMRHAQVSFCMTWEDHCQCQGLSFRLSGYFQELDKLLLAEFGSGWWTIPWVIFWRRQCKEWETSFDEWKTRCLEAKTVGFFNVSGSEDGLHPSLGSCMGVLGSVVSRMEKDSSLPCGELSESPTPLKSSASGGWSDSGDHVRSEVAGVNQKMMVMRAKRLNTVSVGVQTESIASRSLGCQAGESKITEAVNQSGGQSPSGECMVVQLVCRHLRILPKDFWGSLVDLPCLVCQ